MAAWVTRERCIERLCEISARPTAPFFEARVAAYILEELQKLGLAVQRDSYGNIIATYSGSGADESAGIALVAHMDHPGCEIIEAEGRQARARLLGGVNQRCFARPVPVRIFPALQESVAGTEAGIAARVRGYEIPTDGSRLLLDLDLESPLALDGERQYFGIWDLPQIEIDGEIARLRAVDDLAGCAAILLTLELLVERQAACRCYGVFTRAEEVGLLGATLLASEQILPKDTVMVSLETSRALPGAEIGAGPVIRVGDRIRTFDGNAEAALQAAQRELFEEDPEVKVQRQLMSGGACEATTFVLAGYPTTAMALPLGNYHNVDPDYIIAPEYIHLGDLTTEVELLTRAPRYVGVDAASGLRKLFRKRAEEAAERLQTSFEQWSAGDAAN